MQILSLGGGSVPFAPISLFDPGRRAERRRHREAREAVRARASLPTTPTLFATWREAPWDAGRWPNFSPAELACRCHRDGPNYCGGEFYYDPEFFDGLQHIRNVLGVPLVASSEHRCRLRNAHVGGAPRSQHRKMAWDQPLAGLDPAALYHAAVEAGFKSFGFYQSFLHFDRRPGRRWYSSQKARELWTSYLM